MFAIRPWLFTGSYLTTQDLETLQQYGIGAMLQLHRAVQQPGIVSKFLYTEEGYPITKGMLDAGLGFVTEQQAQGRRVLIACASGISRSSLLAVAALCRIEGLSMENAFWQVRAVNKDAMPDEIQWNSVSKYFGDKTQFWDLWRTAEL